MRIPFPKYEAEVVAEIEAYLDMDYQTEITHEEEHEALGVKYTWARGHNPNGRPDLVTRNENNYARPMFQLITQGAFSGGGPSVTPCMACDRFDRSWACTEHTEIPWDSEKRRWIRPGRENEVTAYYSPEAPPVGVYATLVAQYARVLEQQDIDARRFFTNAVQDEERERQRPRYVNAADRCTCSMCRNGGPNDLNVGRPGYHYDFAQNRWAPDTDDALGDFRAGGEVGGGFLLQLDSVPDELLPPHERFMRNLPDFSITLEGTFDPRFLEISGDTVQTPASTVRIEVESDGDTTP